MPPPASFHAHYQALVSSGAIEADAAQARAVEALGALAGRPIMIRYVDNRDLGKQSGTP